jgi:catechol 2,3-dioxygenase-like lactoylglutathione lyase family enzyme
MTLSRLDHVTVNCGDLDRSRDFYAKALGLREGDRPAFGFPGAWFYLEERPVVHLIGGGRGEPAPSTGAFDHVAFEARDFDAVLARLTRLGLAPDQMVVPGGRLRQIFVQDPDGVKIELNFRS